MMHTTYTGERVRLRPWASVDEWQYIVALDCQEPNAHWGPWHAPRAGVAKDFDATGVIAPDKYSALAIESLETGEVVGLEEHGGIHAGRTSTWIGTFVTKDQRRKGYGVEAKKLMLCYLFENYPLASVIADTTATHRDAQRSLELCGMHYVGARRKALCYHGNYVDVVLYQIMRDEWEQSGFRTRVRRG